MTRNGTQQPAAGPWLPMEQAPKDGSKILVCFKDGNPFVVRWSSFRNIWIHGDINAPNEYETEWLAAFAHINPPEAEKKNR